MARGRHWSEEELERLRELTAQGLKPSAIAHLFGRNTMSVRDRVRYERVQRGEPRKNPTNYVRTETPACAQALAERDARCEASYRRSITQEFFGDPPPGWSALDKRQA